MEAFALNTMVIDEGGRYYSHYTHASLQNSHSFEEVCLITTGRGTSRSDPWGGSYSKQTCFMRHLKRLKVSIYPSVLGRFETTNDRPNVAKTFVIKKSHMKRAMKMILQRPVLSLIHIRHLSIKETNRGEINGVALRQM